MKTEMHSTAPYRKILRFISRSRSIPEGTTDGAIARTILASADKMSRLTVEKIANDSMTSLSSVSRFFLKMGFEDYKDFKRCAEEYFDQIGNRRLRALYRKYGEDTILEVSDSIYDEAIESLQNSRARTDEKKLLEIAGIINDKKNIWLIGDERELNSAMILQLDLLIHHHGAYMLNINDFHESLFVDEKMEDAVLVFFNVYSEWYGNEIKEYAKFANKRQIPCILFAQDSELILPNSNITYYYGQEGSMNTGYHSLNCVFELLSSYLYLSE